MVRRYFILKVVHRDRAAGLPGVSAQNGSPYEVVTLLGRAILPADTFAEGTPTGTAFTETNGRVMPFESPPVQGFSALLPAPGGHYYMLSDNGFGTKNNSADYHLRWYEVALDFDAGTVAVIEFTELSDPDRHVPFPIVNDDSEDRILTGADFDPESFRQAADGSFWIGDEFGPFLLHVDAAGKVIEAPYPTPYPPALDSFARGLPFVQSPENPDFVNLTDQDARLAAANLPTTRGFEGMALNTSGTMLYPMLEGVLLDDTDRTRLLIQEFDLLTTTYTGRYWFYPLSDPGNAATELTAINDHEFLVIERDGEDGVKTVFKRIYRVDMAQVSADGFTLEKTMVADLLDIADPDGITKAEAGAVGLGSIFKFPFATTEALYPVDANTLLVANDNNYPFSAGRRPGIAPDDNEFILIGLPEALALASE